MDRETIKKSQAKTSSTALFPHLNYLFRLRKRMEDVGFPHDDKLYLLVCKAYDSMHHLSVEVPFSLSPLIVQLPFEVFARTIKRIIRWSHHQRKESFMSQKSAQAKRKTIKPAKLSRTKRPEGMSLEDWQIDLRRELGRTQTFDIKNLGDDPIFSEFQVRNSQSQSAYSVIIRGNRLGDNTCTCADFATNTLGTCKHIEFTLAQARKAPRRQSDPRTELSAQLQRGLPALRHPARRPLSRRHRLPARTRSAGRAVFFAMREFSCPSRCHLR